MELTFGLTQDALASTQGMNGYELMQSADPEMQQLYSDVLKPIHGALSYNADNDADTKFRIALVSFKLTAAQEASLQKFGREVVELGPDLDSPRMRFEIGITSDGEVYISRNSGFGINNILIYEDGTMAHSFISYKKSGKEDFLHFLEPAEAINHKNLLIDFFAYR